MGGSREQLHFACVRAGYCLIESGHQALFAPGGYKDEGEQIISAHTVDKCVVSAREIMSSQRYRLLIDRFASFCTASALHIRYNLPGIVNRCLIRDDSDEGLDILIFDFSSD